MGEDSCLEALAAHLERQHGHVDKSTPPDEIEREKPAIDALWTAGTKLFAIEHTEISVMESERKLSKDWERFVEDLRAATQGRLPDGRWQFAPDSFETTFRKSDQGAFKVTVDAIVREATTITCERSSRHRECSQARIDGQWPGMLYRWPRLSLSGAWISLGHHAPGQLSMADQIAAECVRVREEKVPKLTEAASENSARAVLLLELANIQLVHPIELAMDLGVHLQGEAEMIILAATHNDEVLDLVNCRTGELLNP